MLDLDIKKLNPPSLFFSNQLEKLFAHLQGQLFSKGSDLFSSRLIIVPSPAVEQWVRFRLADHLGIATAIQTTFLVEGTYRLLQERPVQKLEHALFLAEKILQSISQEDPIFEPVRRYIGEHPQRLMLLAKKLSYLFQRYGLYGVQHFQHPWQHVLWEQSRTHFPALIDLLKHSPRVYQKIHLFGLNHLPPALFHFFEQQGACFYFLSPCQEFWSELYSEACCGDQPQPLLLALGRVGGQVAKMVEDSSILTYEDYQEESLFPIQNALLHLQPLEADASIEIHAASTPMREVQILYQTLQPYLAQGLEPKDILIMAPDITFYAPYLRAIFGDWVFLKEPTKEEDDGELRALKLLLSLEEKRWSATDVLKVLRCPLFKARWSTKQMDTIHRWVTQTGIRWGIDGAYRERILGIATQQGTWKEGCSQLLEELAYGGSRIDFPDAELLGELMDILAALPRALEPLNSEKHSLAQWARICLDLYEQFFDVATGMLAQRLTPLLGQLHAQIYTFQEIRPLFDEVLSQPNTEHRMHNLQRICCDCLLPMRCLPAKVICLLGMNEDAFPRHVSDSLDALQSSKDLPSQADFDRYLFLETLLSYRQKLVITYQGRDPSDGTSKPPSQVLQMLLPYVKHHIHPLHGYDKSYFLEGGLSGSKESFEICQAKSQRLVHPVLFHAPQPIVLPPQEVILDVYDLLRCVRAPLRHFYAQMNFSERQKRSHEDPLSANPLTLAKLRHLCLKMPQQQAIELLQRQGEIPTGMLFEAAKRKIETQLLDIPTQCYELHVGVKTPCEIEQGVFHLPSLSMSVQNTTVHLVGRLEGVAPHGIILPDKGDLIGVIKWWPVCVLSHLLGLSSSWIFSKDQKQRQAFFQDATPLLKNLLTYYFQSKLQPSPLYPQAVLPLLKSDRDRVLQALQEARDPALQWALQTQEFGEQLEAWQQIASQLYQEMIHAWF